MTTHKIDKKTRSTYLKTFGQCRTPTNSNAAKRRALADAASLDATSVTSEKQHEEHRQRTDQLRNALLEQDRGKVGQAARGRVNQRENHKISKNGARSPASKWKGKMKASGASDTMAGARATCRDSTARSTRRPTIRARMKVLEVRLVN